MPTPSLQAQFLTEEQVGWILNVGVRTLREWRKRRVIPFFKSGKNVVRYDPSAVAEYIMRNTRGAMRGPVGTLPANDEAEAWGRIERMIAAAVSGQQQQREAA